MHTRKSVKQLSERQKRRLRQQVYKGVQNSCTTNDKSSSLSLNLGLENQPTENDITNINKKLDAIILMLSNFKIELFDIKERIESPKTPKEEEQLFPLQLPTTSLEELESLNKYASSDEGKPSFIKELKKVGGNDAKDFTNRILRLLLTNSLAELCSWTGRKDNFAIGGMAFMKLIFGVVHYKTLIINKKFENTVMEWLRHAKQRRLRE